MTEVDPADPWGDVCARWRQLCLLMGYAPEDLHPHRTLRPEELFFADPWQGEQSISGWNWWTACGGWEGSENCTKQCLSEISTTPQRYPTNAAWVLSRTGTIYPVPAGSYISDPSPAMRLATDPTVLTAASLYLSVRSCSGIDFISSACGPDTYRTQWRTVSKADEKLLDPPRFHGPRSLPLHPQTPPLRMEKPVFRARHTTHQRNQHLRRDRGQRLRNSQTAPGNRHGGHPPVPTVDGQHGRNPPPTGAEPLRPHLQPRGLPHTPG